MGLSDRVNTFGRAMLATYGEAVHKIAPAFRFAQSSAISSH
jgi:hypothetical protein